MVEVIQFMPHCMRAEAPSATLLERLNTWRPVLHRRQLIGRNPNKYDGLSYGNISERVQPLDAPAGQRAFVITGTQTSWQETLTPAEYVTVNGYDLEKNTVEYSGTMFPSSESLTHAALYDCSQSIRAVFHIHDTALWDRYHLLLPNTGVHAENGTVEMALETQRLYRTNAFKQFNGFIMAGHKDGLCVFGSSVDDAGKSLLKLLET